MTRAASFLSRGTDTTAVILPVFNGASFLPRCVASVQAQSDPNWQLWIVDDGSVDATHDIARGLADQDSRIHVLRCPHNVGVAQARNMALRACDSRFVAFLDVDDIWAMTKLATQHTALREQEAALCYTGFNRIRPGRPPRRVHVPRHTTRAQLLNGNVMACSSVLCDRGRLGAFEMPDLPMRQDFATWLDLMARIDGAIGIDRPLVELHMRAGSLSANKLKASLATWQMLHTYIGLSRGRAALHVSRHLIQRVLRG